MQLFYIKTRPVRFLSYCVKGVISVLNMDTLDDDSLVEVYRRVSAPGFRFLAPLLLLNRKQCRLALSHDVLRHLTLQEFFNNPDMIHEQSIYRAFFKKCVASHNPIATYLESLRIACKTGELSHSVALLFATVPEAEYATFARGLLLIYADFPSEGISTLSDLLSRLGNVDRLHATAEVGYRHVIMLQPVKKRVFSNIHTLGLIPPCSRQPCHAENQCLNCFLYWFIIRFNNIF